VGEDLVGYTLVLLPATSTMWSDTWVTGDRTAKLETLVVAPEQRGKGIGTLLSDQVESELDRLRIIDIIIASLPSNTKTLDMYRRWGFEPTRLVLLCYKLYTCN
jgi:ribosomal protein S18 acetylase RimI-like enzyme